MTLLGITFSAAEALKQWSEEVGLQCDLLSDADRAVGLAYGAASSADQEKASRMSVLVGPDGNVVKVYPNPDPERHALEVLERLRRSRANPPPLRSGVSA